MEEKNKNSKMPLLYIHQPAFREPRASMQTHYRGVADDQNRIGTPGKKEGNQKEDFSDTVKKRRNKPEALPELKFEENSAPEQTAGEEPASAADYFRTPPASRQPFKGLRPVKPFPAMELEEKLHYLSERPAFYHCRFFTQNNMFIGKLYELGEEEVVIEASSGEYLKIPREQLLDIRIKT